MTANYDESNRFLGMLAEVAVKTLNAEEHQHWNRMNDQKRLKNVLNLDQLRKLSDKVLVESFSELSFDEMRRIYRLKCVLMPEKCCLAFESDAGEDRTRTQMRDHLWDHIRALEPDSEHPVETLSARRLDRRHESNRNSRKSEPNTNYSTIDLPTIIVKDNINQMSYNKSSNIDYQLNNNLFDLSFDVKSIGGQRLDSNSEDHCYTSLNGPKLKSNPIKKSAENVLNILNKCLNSTKVIPPFPFIATPPFPFIYEPVLPNISQVIEIGSTLQTNRSKVKKSGEELDETVSESIIDDVNGNTNSVQLKRLALQYINDIRVKSRGQSDKSSFRCKICIDKSFTSPTTLIYHYRSHAGVKPYECSLCKATFTRQHSLNYHMLIHLNKSRFVCDQCGRNFRHPSHFKEHMRRHTGETPYECSECLIKFKTRNTYKRHLQTKHAKMLTSKGIFDLPNSNLHLRKPCPPRRKYGLGFLHQNIEAVARYERAQEEVNQTIRNNCHLINAIDSNLLLNNCNKNFNSSKNNFEKLLQAVAIAEDDERALLQ